MWVRRLAAGVAKWIFFGLLATNLSAQISQGGQPNQVRGPGFSSLDSSLFKNFPTSRETNLQFRLETFNTLNHPMFGNPGQLNFTNLSGFSKITTERTNNGNPGGRIVQLALKYFF